jgi:hypothetical protein
MSALPIAKPVVNAARGVDTRGLTSDALYAGRSLLEGDLGGVRDAFTPSRAPRGLGADAPIDTSYRMTHQPVGPDSEIPIRLDDLTKSITGERAGYPEDFYSSQGPRFYAPAPSFPGDEYGIANQQSYRAIASVRNNPDAEITIYRGVPEGVDSINAGDWVTLSPKYAELHAASGYGPRGEDAGRVISQKVRVKDIYWAGDDVNEFGYFPSQSQPSLLGGY